MDVNEHEVLSNFTLKTHIKVKAEHFYCCSTFHNHNNEHNLCGTLR